MIKWIRDCVLILGMAAAVTLSAMAYHNSVKPDPPAPVITVIEVQDPELATAMMVIGQKDMQVQNLIDLCSNYAALFDLQQKALLEAVRTDR